jgi:hypothetical protein
MEIRRCRSTHFGANVPLVSAEKKISESVLRKTRNYATKLTFQSKRPVHYYRLDYDCDRGIIKTHETLT